MSFKSDFARFQNLDENKIITDYQSRVNSQANIIPPEKFSSRKMAPQKIAPEYDENVPF